MQQEWVDIPSWIADYYLAVQVLEEEDECWARVWGFATGQTLRQKAEYDSLRRAYTLNREDLIEDFNVLLVARKVRPEQKTVAQPLPDLSSHLAKMLLEELGQPTPYSPRLEKEFEQWAALLENKIWREELYQSRLRELPPLSKWFALDSKNFIETMKKAGWQEYHEVFKPAEAAALARRLRSTEKQPNVSWAKQIKVETRSPEITVALGRSRLRWKHDRQKLPLLLRLT